MASILDPRTPIPTEQKAYMLLKDSTLSMCAMNAFGGYALGIAFTLFGAVLNLETATQTMGAADFMRHTMRSAHRSGCGFGMFGLMFGGLDVMMEKRRGKKDFWNPTITGGLVGGAYGWRYYKYPGLVGGFAGGAVASYLIERLMDSMGMSQH